MCSEAQGAGMLRCRAACCGPQPATRAVLLRVRGWWSREHSCCQPTGVKGADLVLEVARHAGRVQPRVNPFHFLSVQLRRARRCVGGWDWGVDGFGSWGQSPQAHQCKPTHAEEEAYTRALSMPDRPSQGASQRTPAWAARERAGSQVVAARQGRPNMLLAVPQHGGALCLCSHSSSTARRSSQWPNSSNISCPTCAWRASLLLEATASAREPMARPKSSTPQAISTQSTSHSATFTGTMSPAAAQARPSSGEGQCQPGLGCMSLAPSERAVKPSAPAPLQHQIPCELHCSIFAPPNPLRLAPCTTAPLHRPTRTPCSLTTAQPTPPAHTP